MYFPVLLYSRISGVELSTPVALGFALTPLVVWYCKESEDFVENFLFRKNGNLINCREQCNMDECVGECLLYSFCSKFNYAPTRQRVGKGGSGWGRVKKTKAFADLFG